MTNRGLSRRTLLHGAGLIAGGAIATGAGISPANAHPASPTKTGPLTAAYIEVNNHSISVVGDYQLASTGAPVYDLAMIFASNINYDTERQRAYLHFNDNVTRTLENRKAEIAPLQRKGIKVLLSVLGNHQGAGICNFADYAAADAFAKEVAVAVYRYGLDGVDFDDEWSKYGENGTGPVNDWSFVHLCQALRKRMPNKIISLYWYGPVTQHLEYDGVRAGDLIDYSWNSMYGTWNVPGVDGLTKDQLGPAAIWTQNTSSDRAEELAARTVSEGYGVYLTYDLRSGDASQYVSGFTRELYGSDAIHTGA